MKKIIIIIVVLLTVTSTVGYSDMLNTKEYIENLGTEGYSFTELSFNNYSEKSVGKLELTVIGKNEVTITFYYYLELQELDSYVNASYFYDINKDVLIIINDNGEVIYSDIDL